MRDVRAVLIPLDGSDLAETALLAGSAIARRLNAFIHLVRVHTQLPLMGAEVVALSPETERAVEQEEESYLEGVAARLRADGLAVSSAVVKGAIVPALQDYAERHGIGLVVMTTHGRGGIRRAVLGSVTDHLVRSIPLPVLIVTPAMAPRIDDGWPRRVLLPLDGSSLGNSAVKALDQIDPLRCSHLILTTVLTTTLPAFSPWGFHFEPSLMMPAAEDDRLRSHLQATAEKLRGGGYRTSVRIMEGGTVAREILTLAVGRQCDLIVMATHGASGLDRVMFGSVTDQVIRHSSIPLLVVRPSPADITPASRTTTPAFAGAGA
jgi:nucleotide-binding universal stress UspA family protein